MLYSLNPLVCVVDSTLKPSCQSVIFWMHQLCMSLNFKRNIVTVILDRQYPSLKEILWYTIERFIILYAAKCCFKHHYPYSSWVCYLSGLYSLSSHPPYICLSILFHLTSIYNYTKNFSHTELITCVQRIRWLFDYCLQLLNYWQGQNTLSPVSTLP